MKLYLFFIVSLVCFSASSYADPSDVISPCGCKDCKCATEAHCGCLTGKGCKCSGSGSCSAHINQEVN